MKKIISFIFALSSALTIANTHASEAEIKIATFIGEYKLIKTIKESNNHFTVRGSKCRDVLKVSLNDDQDLLILYSNNTRSAGITMNWIELNPQEGNETISNDVLLKQTRSGKSVLFGINQKSDFVTTMTKKANQLSLKYEEVSTTVFNPSGKVVSVSDCLYEEM